MAAISSSIARRTARSRRCPRSRGLHRSGKQALRWLRAAADTACTAASRGVPTRSASTTAERQLLLLLMQRPKRILPTRAPAPTAPESSALTMPASPRRYDVTAASRLSGRFAVSGARALPRPTSLCRPRMPATHGRVRSRRRRGLTVGDLAVRCVSVPRARSPAPFRATTLLYCCAPRPAAPDGAQPHSVRESPFPRVERRSACRWTPALLIASQKLASSRAHRLEPDLV